MIKQNNSKLLIGNGIFKIYLLYILWVTAVEWINFAFSMIGFHILSFGIAEFVALLLIIGLLFLSRNYISNESISVSPEFWIGMILILTYGCLTSVYPDRGWDTFNYHIIAQSPQFRNYFGNTYFGYGLFQVWGFRLGDRCFYYFRYLLGFRMGTILNTFVLVIAYSQICKILDLITEHYGNKLALRICCNKLIWAIVILLDKQALLMFASYYVDILAIPIGLEVLRVLYKSTKRETDSLEIIYFALLNGIWLGFKMTNIIYVCPCVFLFLFNHFREFKITNWFAAIFMGLYSFAVYLMYTFLYTGNPVFPYYNSIFKSSYYPITNFKDGRWGGITIWEKLFWVLYAALKPEYRQCELYENTPSAVLIIGLIGMVTIITYAIVCKVKYNKKIHKNPYFLLIEVTLLSSVLWSFTTGYSRYFIFGKVLWGLVAYNFLVNFQRRFHIIGKIFAGVVSLLVIINLESNIVFSFEDGVNWSWNVWRKETFKEELKFVFKDRTLTNDYRNNVDLFVLMDQSMQGIAEMLGSDISIINANYAPLAKEEYQLVLNDQLSTAQTVADIHSRNLGNIIEYIDVLNKNGFIATSFENIETNLGNYEIISLESAINTQNTYWVSDGNPYSIFIDKNVHCRNLSFIAGKFYDWEGITPITLKIYASNGLTERIISTILVDNVLINKFSIPLDLKEDDEYLIIRAYQSDIEFGLTDEPNKVFVLNANIE